MKKEVNKLKRGQLYWKILEVIALSLVAGGGHPLRPTLFIAVKEIHRLLMELKALNVEEKKIQRTLRNLEKREILDLVQENDEVHVYIKDKENPTIVKYSIKTLLDFKKKKKKWDGKWFLVFFDVPEIQRNKRNYLREFLEEIGFYRYQKSVYIFPYACEEEVALIKKIVAGAKYMKYIIAEKIEDENIAKAHFNLK